MRSVRYHVTMNALNWDPALSLGIVGVAWYYSLARGRDTRDFRRTKPGPRTKGYHTALTRDHRVYNNTLLIALVVLARGLNRVSDVERVRGEEKGRADGVEAA